MPRRIRAVTFDLGGVVLGSPLAALNDAEARLGLPPHTIGQAIAGLGADGAWARLERGEIAFADFIPVFQGEIETRGIRLDVASLIATVESSLDPRDKMLAAIRSLRDSRYAVAALTNNWSSSTDMAARFHALASEFDVFIESHRVGSRKPEAAIFEHLCGALDLPPVEIVFLDDLGGNLKPARAMGMTTIKVTDPDQALDELESVLRPDWARPADR